MLTVHLKSGEYLTIGEDIIVQVHSGSSGIYVSVQAPREMTILRSDLHPDEPEGLKAKHKSPSRRKRDAQRYQALQERKKAEAQ